MSQSIEDFIRETFNENFDSLKTESAHTIPPHLKELALQQVLLYWQKLKIIAEKVSETEVKLILPEQSTPKNRRYTIEGVVDIVVEDGRVVMYDLKTHDSNQVRCFLELYAKQLNVYAHIWHNLRGQQLDEVAIIATAPPQELLDAIDIGNLESIKEEMEKWDPVVHLEVDQAAVDNCIADFGSTVDLIEEGEFQSTPLIRLEEYLPGRQVKFGTAICRYCDARFSCESYRQYAQLRPNAKSFEGMQYFFNDYGDESDRNHWLETTLDTYIEPVE